MLDHMFKSFFGRTWDEFNLLDDDKQ